MEQTISFQLMKLYRQFVSFSKEKLQEADLSFGLLRFVVYLGKEPGATQSQMAAFLGTDVAYTARAVEKLVEGGHVRKEKSMQDGRAFALYLTPKGKEAFEKARQLFSQWDEQMTAAMTAEEKADCLERLARLRKAGEADV